MHCIFSRDVGQACAKQFDRMFLLDKAFRKPKDLLGGTHQVADDKRDTRPQSMAKWWDSRRQTRLRCLLTNWKSLTARVMAEARRGRSCHDIDVGPALTGCCCCWYQTWSSQSLFKDMGDSDRMINDSGEEEVRKPPHGKGRCRRQRLTFHVDFDS